MRKFSLLFSSLVMTTMLLFLGGCQREDSELMLPINENFIKLESWNQSQKLFFNRNNVSDKKGLNGNIKTSVRTVSASQLHQAHIRFYNELVRWDQEHGLVAKISDGVGVPFWSKGTVYAAKDDGFTFYLPLGFLNGHQTEALISGVETSIGGTKKYIFKLSERSEIQSAVDDPTVFAKYNNFGMELLHFIHNDYYTYGNPSQAFAKDFAIKYNNGIDMQGARNGTLLNLNGDHVQSRSNCDCDVKEAEFWVDENGNIIGEFGDGSDPEYHDSGEGSNGNSNNDPTGGGSGPIKDGNPWNPNETTTGGGTGTTGGGTGTNGGGTGTNGGGTGTNGGGGGIPPNILCQILELLFGIKCKNNPLPGYAIKDNNHVSGRGNTLITQAFLDCGQDGFSPEDLLVGSKKEGNTLNDMASAYNLSCDQLKCLNSNPGLFDRANDLKENPPINPCTGSAIDLTDAINKALAAACEMAPKFSISTFDSEIDKALDNTKGAVTTSQLDYYKDLFESLGLTNPADQLKFLGGCDDDWQAKLTPIDWNTSSCDQIFAQMLTGIRLQYAYINCFGGQFGDFNFEHFFTNISLSKTCANVQYVTPQGKVIKGGFDFNFLHNLNPNGTVSHGANGYFEHNGTTYGTGKPTENYNMYSNTKNVIVLNLGITEGADAAFIDFIHPPCKK